MPVPCPLTPALRTLLETAVALRTTNNQVLAQALGCSEETIKSGFRRTSLLLDTHSRAESLLCALLNGWVHVPSPINLSPPASTECQYIRR
jgi:hypothetical protein